MLIYAPVNLSGFSESALEVILNLCRPKLQRSFSKNRDFFFWVVELLNIGNLHNLIDAETRLWYIEYMRNKHLANTEIVRWKLERYV